MTTPCVDILYLHYASEDGTVSIGGVQTYIRELSLILIELGARVRICQFAPRPFLLSLQEDITVQGFPVPEGPSARRYQRLYDEAYNTRSPDHAFTLFATDNIIPHKLQGRAMAIQHGIAWDIPRTNRKASLLRQFLGRCRNAYGVVRRISSVEKVVCVDYNFVNWYRTQVYTSETPLLVIPNYAHISPPSDKPRDTVNLIFARRLCDYRGTRVFTRAVIPLLDRYPELHVTIAGSGPDEAWMREQLASYDAVRFIRYEAHESAQIHSDQHIAVVPTVGAEGTSLSLLEAMAAGCAVICTDVGGMTQIVVNGSNGRMVPAGDTDSLRQAIEDLICDRDQRAILARRGYDCVTASYSYDRWRTQWTRILLDMLGKE